MVLRAEPRQIKRRFGTIQIHYSLLWTVALFYLSAPVWIFLLAYVRLLIGIPVFGFMLVAFWFAIREKRNDRRCLDLSWPVLVWIVVMCGAWCYFGGQGGVFYQTSDWNIRNAIFRDLILNPWPVYYPVTDTMLTYYIGHWLPAAAISRIYLLLTDNVLMAWRLGRLLLGMWTMLGVFLAMIAMLFHLGQQHRGRVQILAALIFVLFSGLDVVGCWIQGWRLPDFLGKLHLEWWSGPYQFSSNTTCLFWVFNQAVAAWVVVLCFLNEQRPRNYAYLIVCAFISSPLPCVGIGIYMVGTAICWAVQELKSRSFLQYLKDVFTVQNIIPVLTAFPVLTAYFLTNAATEKTLSEQTYEASGQVGTWIILGIACLLVIVAVVRHFAGKKWGSLGATALIGMIGGGFLYFFPPESSIYYLFLLLEAGVYLIPLWYAYRDMPVYYITWIVFLITPLLKIGSGADFCMRASIPAVITLMVLVMRYMLTIVPVHGHHVTVNRRIISILLAICLVIGAATPCMEFFRGGYYVLKEHSLHLAADNMYTLNKYHESGRVYGYFLSDCYQNSIFYKYMAAPND